MAVPSDVLINYISPGGTTTDITKNVTYADAYFEVQAAAVPGSFHIAVKDPDQTLYFETGGRIELTVDSTKQGGYFITQRTMDFFVPADDTSSPVRTRRWQLDGVDYNLLLDKRILRSSTAAGKTHKLAKVTVASGNCYDQYIIGLFSTYFDLGFSGGGTVDVSTAVQHVNDFTVDWIWPEQGSTMRKALDALVIETTIHGNNACIYWMNADAEIEWLDIATNFSTWGFSDVPDGSSFIGWREGAAIDDGSSVINETFIWGGSPIGTKGTVVMAHRSNSTSISDHGRWQLAESHPGEVGYKSQAEVNARANALISGNTSGTSAATGAQGLVNPDEQYRLTWFAHDVPGSPRQHLVPGQAVTLNLWSFSQDGGTTPFALNVPLRQIRITFPTLPSDNPAGDPQAFVQFTGTFGLLMSDPVWWWAWLRNARAKVQIAPVYTTDETSTTFPYGSYYTGTPDQAADGVRTAFWIQTAYIEGSMQVWVNGVLQEKGVAWTEADPDTGEFDFTTAPTSGAVIRVTCRTA